MKRKIKVAYFAEVLEENIDGVSHTIHNIIRNIPFHEFEFIFITPRPPANKEVIPFEIIQCPSISFPLYKDYPFSLPFLDRKIKRSLKEFNPHIIHFSTPSLLGLYAAQYAVKKKLPLFTTYHTHFFAYIDYYPFFKHFSSFWKSVLNRIVRSLYNKCETVLVPTEPIKTELAEYGFAPSKLLVWGRGIDTSVFNPSFDNKEGIKKQYNFREEKIILFVGRLVWEKGLAQLIQVYNELNRKRRDCKLVITGSGPCLSLLKKKMPTAVFTGKMQDKALSTLFASADVFLFPSTTETFGNVVLEALASGTPAVVAAKGGPLGIVMHGHNGFHVQPDNTEQYIARISEIIDDPDLHKSMQKNAVRYAEKQMWANLCNELFTLYKNAHARSSTEL